MILQKNSEYKRCMKTIKLYTQLNKYNRNSNETSFLPRNHLLNHRKSSLPIYQSCDHRFIVLKCIVKEAIE